MLHEMNKMGMGSMNKKHSMPGMDMNMQHENDATQKTKMGMGKKIDSKSMPNHEGMTG